MTGLWLPVYAAPAEGDALRDLGALPLGVGKAAAAAALADRLASGPRPELVLLFGVAGAYHDRHRAAPARLRPGQLCVVAEDAFADEGVATATGFLDLPALGLGAAGPLPMAGEASRQAAARLQAPLVRGATVSTCSGTDALACTLAARTGADVETMEGAAVALACARRGVPLVQLRAISNWCGDRDRGAWDLGTAVAVVQAAVRRLLPQ